MRPFSYVRPTAQQDACTLARADGSTFLAGGTDLVPRMKADLVDRQEGSRLVSLRDLEGGHGIRTTQEGGLWIGAMTTLAEVLEDRWVREQYPILAEALRDAATPQLRNVATVGGNLLQRSRCPHYRTPGSFSGCLLKGGDGCPAEEGESRFHALFGEGVCRSGHPSDLAPALLALNAVAELLPPDGAAREVPLQALYAPPSPERRMEHVLEGGVLLRGVRLIPAPPRTRQAYRKGMDRAAWSFPLASVALYLRLEEELIEEARVFLGGVASIPWEARPVVDVLEGARLDAQAVEAAVGAVALGARPLARNGYKVHLLRGLMRAALSS